VYPPSTQKSQNSQKYRHQTDSSNASEASLQVPRKRFRKYTCTIDLTQSSLPLQGLLPALIVWEVTSVYPLCVDQDSRILPDHLRGFRHTTSASVNDYFMSNACRSQDHLRFANQSASDKAIQSCVRFSWFHAPQSPKRVFGSRSLLRF
jgi:hypothetical protein